MMSLPDLAIALTRAWTATYTRGLPRDLRAERREEIDCDLWEQQRLADLGREPATATGFHILLRLILGVPEDILWRFEAKSTTQASRRNPVNNTPAMRIGLALALLPPVFLAANGIGMLLGGGEFDSRSEQLLYGFAIVAISTMTMLGLWLSGHSARLGVVMVAGGVTSICGLFYWMLPITIPISIAIVIFAALRGGLLRWPRSGVRPA